MSAEKPHLTSVLPTWNESGNIRPLIEGILEATKDIDAEILVVDDDSPDGTWQIVEEMGKANPRIRVLRRMNEKGLTSAIWAGVQNARGDIIQWMDCDLSMPPSVIPSLVRAIDSGADVALGSRYVPGGRDIGHPFMAKAFSYTINFFASLFLGFQIRDYTSGFVAARREVFTKVNFRGDYGEYCIDFLHRARKKGYRVRELPYDCVPRLTGDSKTATNVKGYLTRGVNYVVTIMRLFFTRYPGRAVRREA